MKKFMLYDTDEGLDFNIPCIPTDLPWVSCRVFRVHDHEDVYFEVIKSEEYLATDILKEKYIGTFESFQRAAEAADRHCGMARHAPAAPVRPAARSAARWRPWPPRDLSAPTG